ncbi:MAG: hypothetical protein ACI9ON_002032 [Limisphaerales bacterium]|jgi:hypothetical protein
MNTATNPSKASHTRAKTVRLVHRYFGLALILPVLLLAVTGVLLEFTDALKLGSRGVESTWVHQQYGITTPTTQLVSGPATQVGNRTFVTGRQFKSEGALVAATDLDILSAVFTESEVTIVPKEWDIPIERSALPNFNRVGLTTDHGWLLDTTQGILVSRDLGASWLAGDASSAQWLTVHEEATTPQWASEYGAAHLNWERWLQDLHSGRFFGDIGVWIMSFAALAFIALALTGFLVWLSTSRSR